MSTYQVDAILTIIATAALIPLAALPVVGIVVRRYGRLRLWPVICCFGLLGSAIALAAFTAFPLPDPDSLDCTKRKLLDYWQTSPFASITPIFETLRAEGIGATLRSGDFLQVFFNVLLFVPFGFFLHLVTRWKAVWVVLGCFLASLAIELTQGTGFYGLYPCPYRLFDVDDLLVNTLGGAVGVLLSKVVIRWLPGLTPTAVPDLDPPSLQRRVASFLIDYTVAASLSLFGAGILFVLTGPGHDHTGTNPLPPVPVMLIGVAVVAILFVALPLLRNDRATPGEWIANLSIVGVDKPAPPSAVQIAIRFVVRWLPIAIIPHALPIVLAAEAISVLVRRDRRSISDLTAGTRVVTTPSVATRHGNT